MGVRKSQDMPDLMARDTHEMNPRTCIDGPRKLFRKGVKDDICILYLPFFVGNRTCKCKCRSTLTKLSPLFGIRKKERHTFIVGLGRVVCCSLEIM